MEYIIPLALAIIGAFFNKKMPNKIRIVYTVLLLIYIVILLGLRYRVGVDTISYMNGFKDVKTLINLNAIDFIEQRYEPGYLLIASLCKTITKDFWFLQLVMATITNGCIFIFLNRYCKNIFIGITIYFLLQWLYFSTEIMRESAAVGIFLLNFKNLQEKKWINYYLISLLSISFHYSAIIIWIFPLAKLLKSNLLFIIFCSLMIVITPFIKQLNEMLYLGTIYDRLDMYLTITEKLNINWKLGELLRSALPAILTLIAYRITKTNLAFNTMILLQILLCFGAFSIPLVFSRFTNYTTMFVTASIANFLSIGIIRNWVKLTFICLVLMSQSYYYSMMYHRWFPYVSIFNPKQINTREQIWKNDFLFSF